MVTAVQFALASSVGTAYRDTLRHFKLIFTHDRKGCSAARTKLKYFIRENPAQLSHEELATQVREVGKAMRCAVVRAESNPVTGGWRLDLRPENFVDGRVELPRTPQTRLHRIQNYIRTLFKNKASTVSDDQFRRT